MKYIFDKPVIQLEGEKQVNEVFVDPFSIWDPYSPFGKRPSFVIRGVYKEEGMEPPKEDELRERKFSQVGLTFESGHFWWWDKSPMFNEIMDTLRGLSDRAESFQCVIYADSHMCAADYPEPYPDEYDHISAMRVDFKDGEFKIAKFVESDVVPCWSVENK